MSKKSLDCRPEKEGIETNEGTDIFQLSVVRLQT